MCDEISEVIHDVHIPMKLNPSDMGLCSRLSPMAAVIAAVNPFINSNNMLESLCSCLGHKKLPSNHFGLYAIIYLLTHLFVVSPILPLELLLFSKYKPFNYLGGGPLVRT